LSPIVARYSAFFSRASRNSDSPRFSKYSIIMLYSKREREREREKERELAILGKLHTMNKIKGGNAQKLCKSFAVLFKAISERRRTLDFQKIRLN
jgi:hypothetical protein